MPNFGERSRAREIYFGKPNHYLPCHDKSRTKSANSRENEFPGNTEHYREKHFQQNSFTGVVFYCGVVRPPPRRNRYILAGETPSASNSAFGSRKNRSFSEAPKKRQGGESFSPRLYSAFFAENRKRDFSKKIAKIWNSLKTQNLGFRANHGIDLCKNFSFFSHTA